MFMATVTVVQLWRFACKMYPSLSFSWMTCVRRVFIVSVPAVMSEEVLFPFNLFNEPRIWFVYLNVSKPRRLSMLHFQLLVSECRIRCVY